MTRLHEYLAYHRESARIGDIDPAHAMMKYLVTRYELNPEQALWMCALYAWTYNGASAFYLYNEAPDFENVNIGRLQRWWDSHGRDETVFTTDARWRRSRNQFVDAVDSYRKWIGNRTQAEKFASIATGATPERRYDQILTEMSNLYTIGQFSAFLWTEALAIVGGLDIIPTDLDLSTAWSCRDGLMYAYGYDQWVTGEGPTPYAARDDVARSWSDLRSILQPASTVWAIETTLCAYRKNCDGKRYIGSYVDRQAMEIATMQSHVRDGVCWQPLWDYRRESMDANQLVENEVSWEILAKKGLPDKWKSLRNAKTTVLLASSTPSDTIPAV